MSHAPIPVLELQVLCRNDPVARWGLRVRRLIGPPVDHWDRCEPQRRQRRRRQRDWESEREKPRRESDCE
jgi:hypothetical protein